MSCSCRIDFACTLVIVGVIFVCYAQSHLVATSQLVHFTLLLLLDLVAMYVRFSRWCSLRFFVLIGTCIAMHHSLSRALRFLADFISLLVPHAKRAGAANDAARESPYEITLSGLRLRSLWQRQSFLHTLLSL